MTAIRPAGWSATALFAGAVIGVGAGALTAYLQGVLSANWNTVANSGAVWTIVAFAAAAALGRQRSTAIVTGLLVLVGEVAGYYSYIADVRHVAVLHTAELLWTLAALWIGPLTGLAAYLARCGSVEQRMTSLVAVCGVLVGEGAYLVRLAGVPRAGWVEVLLGVAGGLGVLVAWPAAARARMVALGAGAAVALAVYLAYGQPLLT